jgi:iron complex transport system ATP-binding protein
VEPERLVAVVGPNGSGKTSLARVLLGAVPADTGRVTLDGRPIAAWDRRDLARAVGVVTQREEVPFPIRVTEAVMMGRYPRLGALRSAGSVDHAVVERSLARCDVRDLGSRAIDTLSGGEWQRVRVARALAQEPRLLVLDEPSAALDLRHEMELFELIARLVRDGLGALVVSHHLNIAARFADRVIVLEEGAVAAEGAPEQVFTPDLLSRVFGWPVSVVPGPDGRPQMVPLRRDGGPA